MVLCSDKKCKCKQIELNWIPDWTHALTKFLKDQLNKIADFYQSHFGGITSSQHQQKMTPEMEQALKQWNYTVRLSHWLYEVRDSSTFNKQLLDEVFAFMCIYLQHHINKQRNTLFVLLNSLDFWSSEKITSILLLSSSVKTLLSSLQSTLWHSALNSAMFAFICVPRNNTISACGATLFPGYHSFPKWALLKKNLDTTHHPQSLTHLHPVGVLHV